MSVRSHIGPRAEGLWVEGAIFRGEGPVLEGELPVEEAQAAVVRRVRKRGEFYEEVEDYDPVLRSTCRLDDPNGGHR